MVFDTNILIAYLNGEQVVVDTLSRWRREGRTLFVSAVSIIEVLALQTLTLDEIQAISEFLNTLVCVPTDAALAQSAAALSRKYRLKLPDAAIAVAAIETNAPLVSRDTPFRKVQEITLLKI